ALRDWGGVIDTVRYRTRLVVRSTQSVQPHPPANARAFALLPGYPNPASGKVTLTYWLPAAQAVEFSIYDPRGRLIRLQAWGTQSAGEHQLQWDGMDENGQQVPAGVYLARVRAGSQVAHQKLVLTR
ncbi:MAG: T9SS type A sorting domain-containing protein, partial [candidate division KSB1 bacterium]|nr:T9SS type A sorting domain-containing protein [candidate division KSB1 bacterium]